MLTYRFSLLSLLFSVFVVTTCSAWRVPGAQAGTLKNRLAQPVLGEGVSNSELTQYAKALIEIEPLRLAALETIRAKTNGSLPNLVCNQPDSMASLPAEARKVFVKYCNQSQSIAQKYGLSLNRFNAITSAIRSSSSLQERLRAKVNCLQNGSC